MSKNETMKLKVDPAGRIVIPHQWRAQYDIKPGTLLFAELTDEHISIKLHRMNETCMLCGAGGNIVHTGGVIICERCRERIVRDFRKDDI